MKIGIFGAGHMGGAMIKGWINSKQFDPSDIVVKGGSHKTANELQKKLGFTLTDSIKDFLRCDIIYIAVNPSIVMTVITDLLPIVKEKQIPIVSISAGVTLAEMSVVLGPDYPLAHAIPNTPVQINKGTIGISYQNQLVDNARNLIDMSFNYLGKTIETNEDLLGIFGTLAGCGPAFVDVFMEALADGAVLHGMDRKTAYEVTARMVSSTAELMIATSKHPGELKDQVTSPGGTTIKGVTALEKNGFRFAAIDAIDTIMKTD
ncbi:pyrroline-5-carboxylate reductase [Vagococcus vulneris]|uniref:Pyrroline-5-carboxylate reductase n=1 Tax=Vagococcus vulneris TaxID=1977869 RepID=A0A429ZZB4_9ENTE|nr:pyrroline-5-carboxylate reductase [Vagococcus vulneris]RST99341.1 pyrroline-5-carboxylate reductase [Vagococcus vulneris]